MKNDRATPFKVEIPEEVLRDLQKRLTNTRWPHSVDGTGWNAGTDVHYLRELVDYWQNAYDWRKQAAALNQFAHFRGKVDDIAIHFIYERGKGPNPLPIILTHGYPDSFLRFAKIIPMLTDPVSFGGSAEDAFDVVVPDLPGYGFSDKPRKHGTIFHVHDLWARLMADTLGCRKFVAHGGDWGSTVTEQLARSCPDSVVAIHLTDVPSGHIFRKPDDPSPAETQFFKKKVDTERRNVCTHPVHETAESCPWFERLTRWTGSMDRRKVSRLERLRRQPRIAVHQGRTPHSHHDLLGHRIDRYVVSALLRLFERRRRDVGKGRHQELDRIMQGAGSVCALSQRYRSSPTGMGKPIPRCPALDRDA
jgi:pimeloyl-ACP methyl ester carboxylesterase